jgi:hypothetical protein
MKLYLLMCVAFLLGSGTMHAQTAYEKVERGDWVLVCAGVPSIDVPGVSVFEYQVGAYEQGYWLCYRDPSGAPKMIAVRPDASGILEQFRRVYGLPNSNPVVKPEVVQSQAAKAEAIFTAYAPRLTPSLPTCTVVNGRQT